MLQNKEKTLRSQIKQLRQEVQTSKTVQTKHYKS